MRHISNPTSAYEYLIISGFRSNIQVVHINSNIPKIIYRGEREGENTKKSTFLNENFKLINVKFQESSSIEKKQKS